MDRATMQNLFLYGNPSGPAGQTGTVPGADQPQVGGGQQQLTSQQQLFQQAQQQAQQVPYADAVQQQAAVLEAAQAQHSAMSNYPALMQQYLLQQQAQQQQQQQQAQPGGAGGMDPLLLAGLTGGAGGAAAGLNFGGAQQMGAMAGVAGGMEATSQLLAMQSLQRQAALASQQQGQWLGGAAAGVGDPGVAAAGVGDGADPYAENGIVGPWSATSAGLLGKMATNTTSETKAKKNRKKSKDKPKRPLSAYNIFFKEERARILQNIPEKSEEKDSDEAKDDNKEGDKSGKPAGKGAKKRPHGKIGFENLAKTIGQRWQDLGQDQVEYYKKKADEDMKRYKAQMETYLSKQADKQHDGDGAVPKAAEAVADEQGTEEKPAKKMKTDASAE